MISAVSAANPNTVVVLTTGDAVYMPWLASVKSVLEMWYPGVAGGVATADVLTGAVNPSGKLPITFPDGSAARPRFPTDDPGCNPAAIVIPNNNTGTGANDGNCPLYPGVFLSDPTQGTHTYRTVDMGPTGSSRATAGGTSTIRRRCSRSATGCRTPLQLRQPDPHPGARPDDGRVRRDQHGLRRG